MTDGLLALTTMTASSGPSCGCDALAADAPVLPPVPDAVTPSQTPDPAALGSSAFWEGCIGVEGELTGDGRFIEHNALVWSLPMPLRYVSSDVGEHGGAQVAGRILQVERRPGGVIWGAGDYDMKSPVGIEAERQVREELTNGISMDLDDVSFEVRIAAELLDEMMGDPEGAMPAPPAPNADGTVTVATIKSSDEVRATLSARVRAATIVAIPAFASAQIYSSTTPPAAPPASDAADDVGGGTLAADPMMDGNMDGLMPDGETPCSATEGEPGYDPECVRIQDHEDPQRPSPDAPKPPKPAPAKGNAPFPAKASAAAVVSSAAPLSPPAAWFSNPRFKTATALSVSDDGQIFGHLATWNTCHIGMAHQGCVTAPKSRSGYAYFHTGSLVTAENTEISVGHITLDTTHAPTVGLSAAGAQNHYERTGHVVADVVAGEDSHGIWVSGALRPGVTAAQARELRAAPLSGDWRRISGALELVAALAVNVPGFPIPRPKGLVAGGVVQSLVASGMVPPRQVLRPGTEGALSLDDLKYLKRLADRERREEATLLAAGSLPSATDLARRVRASALAMRAHSTPKG